MEDSLDKAWSEARFVVAYLKDNGCLPPEIVELSLVSIGPSGVAQEPRTWLVRPENKIPKSHATIHGISNQDVKNAPAFADIRGEVHDHLGGHYLVAHAVRLEHEGLKRQIPDWEPRAVIDTVRLAERFVPGLPFYGLSALIPHFGIKDQLRTVTANPLRANYGAVAVAQIFQLLCKTSTGMPRTLAEVLDVGQMQPRG
jgi:DNA polymerase III epsilon subunit-like protein